MYNKSIKFIRRASLDIDERDSWVSEGVSLYFQRLNDRRVYLTSKLSKALRLSENLDRLNKLDFLSNVEVYIDDRLCHSSSVTFHKVEY